MSTYHGSEIDRIMPGDSFAMQIQNRSEVRPARDRTRWLSITPDQARRIRDIVGEDHDTELHTRASGARPELHGGHRPSTYYTITSGDVLGTTIMSADESGHVVAVSDVTGLQGPRLSGHDVGRRVYWTVDDRVSGQVHYHAESDTERSQRIAAYLDARTWVRISETIHHGSFRNINIVGGHDIRAAVDAALSVSPYNTALRHVPSERENLILSLVNRSHGEHGWARYELLTDD